MEKKAFLKQLTDNVPAVIIVYSVETGGYLYVNKSIEDVLGYTQEEVLQGGLRFMTELMHPNDRERINTELQTATDKNFDVPLTLEYRILHKNGSWRWLHTDGVVFEKSPLGKIQSIMNVSVDVTKRKEKEFEVTEKTAKQISEIVESLNDGYTLLDKDWNYVYVNKKAVEFSGKSSQELLGKNMWKMFPLPEDSEFFIAAQKSMNEHIPTRTEAYYEPSQKWYESSNYPTESGLSFFVRDITERKNFEEELHSAKEQLEVILKNIADAVTAQDATGKIIYANEAAAVASGYKSIDEMLVAPPLDYLNKFEIADETGSELQPGELPGKLVVGTANQKQLILKSTNKATRQVSWIKIRSHGILGSNKKTKLVINTMQDITERKRAENNLKFFAEASKILASSLDLQVTFDAVARLVVPQLADWCTVEILDSQGKLQQIAVAHKDPEKVIWARELRKKQPPRMDDPTGLPNVLRTGKAEFYPLITDDMIVAVSKTPEELELVRSLGFTSAIIVPIFSSKKCIGGITFVTTESRRRYIEADLALAEELAVRASNAIENAQLYHSAQKEITERRKLEKQKDEFISIASHELKTPVTSIKAYGQVLQHFFKQKGDDKAVSHLSKMDFQINKLTNLIGDLLDVTKVESGKMIFAEEEFDFDTLVKEVVDEVQLTTDKHVLHIQGQTQKTIIGDKERTGQVLTNLMTNAIKYSPKANQIDVTLSSDEKNVTVSVRDFGIGIPKDKQPRLFERFFRISGPHQETFPGLGLGLYISSEIIKRQGGKIRVESEDGEGATFSFTLPMKKRKRILK